MNARSYQELLNSKHRLSLFLFLYVKKLNLFSCVLGLLWAAHIYVKSQYCAPNNQSFLLISLFSMFFISAIALTDNFIAFCLHAVPSALVILLLDGMHNTTRIVFTTVLPIIAFSIHHLMLKRGELFTQTLVANLYNERDRFSNLSMIDPLTGLYNRRGLENKINMLTVPPSGCHFVVLLDIDHFKAYNDNYGHTMGDQALVQVAITIRDSVRSRDIVVRYGGEEFLVLPGSPPWTNLTCPRRSVRPMPPCIRRKTTAAIIFSWRLACSPPLSEPAGQTFSDGAAANRKQTPRRSTTAAAHTTAPYCICPPAPP